MTIRALLGALSLLAAVPAAAQAAKPLETQRFKVSIKGVQTTAWSYDVPGGGLCNPGGSGEGTEVVRFATGKPKVVEATRFSPTYVAFGAGTTAGPLSARAKVTRHSKHVEGPLDPTCVDPRGGGEIGTPDCGTKHGIIDLRLSYESFGSPRGVLLRDEPIDTPELFQNCSVGGIGFPNLLDRTTNGKDIASDWPVREIMDGRAGKTIVIGRGRKVDEDATSRQETTIRWEVTFRRIRPVRAAAATRAGAAPSTYKGKTENGGSLTFRRSGNTISRVKGAVPTVCLETMGSYQSTAGAELYQPPGSFRLGRSTQVKALQPAAMNQGINATKTYTFSSRPAGNRKVAGKLRLSFSFLRPGPSIYQSYIYTCSSSVSFSAKETS